MRRVEANAPYHAFPFGRADWPQSAAGSTLVHHPIMRRVEANARDPSPLRHGGNQKSEIRNQKSEIRDRAKEGRCKTASQEVLSGMTVPVMISPAACPDNIGGPQSNNKQKERMVAGGRIELPTKGL